MRDRIATCNARSIEREGVHAIAQRGASRRLRDSCNLMTPTTERLASSRRPSVWSIGWRCLCDGWTSRCSAGNGPNSVRELSEAFMVELRNLAWRTAARSFPTVAQRRL